MSMWLDLVGCPYRVDYVYAGAVRTRFLEAGPADQPALIFLHGSGGYLEAYLKNIAAHAGRFRVLAVDMIGHGFTDKPEHPYEPRHYVEHLIAFMDALGIRKAHVSGESLGGWVAARLASSVPERVARLVDPGFGRVFTDHMAIVRYDQGKGWHGARVESRANFPLDPATAVLHYAQEIFEGLSLIHI